MQERYNKALNHFYQAQTNKYMKLEGGSDGNESEVSGEEETKFDFDVPSKNGTTFHLVNSDNNELLPRSHYKKKAKVIPVQPGGICSKHFCFYLVIWVLLFILSVVGLTYFIQRILDRVSNPNEQYIRGKYQVIYNRTTYMKESHLSSLVTRQLQNKIVPCNDFKSSLIWYTTLDKLNTETAIRKLDVNLDGINDFIVGFGTGADGYNVPKSVCQKYFPNIYPCFGGALALNGKDGTELWRHYTQHEVYAVNCNGDLNKDGIPDCLIGGRGSTFEAISGKDGNSLWKFLNRDEALEPMNTYTAQYVRDLNGDGIPEVLQIHGGDPFSDAYSEKRLTGRMMILNGKTGSILTMDEMPDKRESYFSPIIYTLKHNGSEMIVFGTGGETHPGGLWVIPLLVFFSSGLKTAYRIFSDNKKGMMNPPVLIDLNKDGQVDIVMSAFGTSVIAIDGMTFKEMWRTDFQNSESYSVPAPGYFNNDEIPDFMVKYNEGKGFPTYYNSNLTILDGKSGKQIVHSYKTSGAANSSPLSVSVEGVGNDLFVYWIADCLDHEGEGGKFTFVEGTNVHEQSRADTCKLRYHTKGFSKLNVMNKRTGFPGGTIYYSEANRGFEYLKRVSRKKRHIGIPDHGGFQRIISTGTLAAPLQTKNEETGPNAIDVVFAVFWLYPAKVRLMVEKVMECVKKYRERAKLGKVKNNIDINKNRMAGHFDEGDTAVDFCMKGNNVTQRDQIYNSQTDYDPNNIHMGKMTVYRYRIHCQCKNLKPKERCAKILPIESQAWGGYMGSMTNGYFHEDNVSRSRRFGYKS